jgi:hypothetical protein
MNHSEVMANLQYLADAIGPRLTGSAAARKANDWTASKFQGYGLTAALEPWNFGVTWERGPIQVRLLEPFPRQITGHSWAWTAGTNGKTLVGTVMRVNFSTPESLAVYQDKVKGITLCAPFPVRNRRHSDERGGFRGAGEPSGSGVSAAADTRRPRWRSAGSSRWTRTCSRRRERWGH